MTGEYEPGDKVWAWSSFEGKYAKAKIVEYNEERKEFRIELLEEIETKFFGTMEVGATPFVEDVRWLRKRSDNLNEVTPPEAPQ